VLLKSKLKLSGLSPRLRDGSHFSGGQRQDGLRVPVEANKLYFVGFALGVH
jgi:hypothetical protein